jgi:hypothetical protein
MPVCSSTRSVGGLSVSDLSGARSARAHQTSSSHQLPAEQEGTTNPGKEDEEMPVFSRMKKLKHASRYIEKRQFSRNQRLVLLPGLDHFLQNMIGKNNTHINHTAKFIEKKERL